MTPQLPACDWVGPSFTKSQSLDFDSNVQVACLRPPDPPIGSNLVVANWDDGQPIPFGEEVILYVTRT